MSVTIKSDNRELLKALDKLGDKWKFKIKEQVFRSAQNIEKDAKVAAPVFEGTLRSSINTKLIDKGFTAKVGTGVLNGEKLAYAEAVEFGRKAGSFPPWGEDSSLYRWVRLKLKVTGKATKSAAFLIARHMSKFPTEAQPYLMPAYRNERPVFMKKLTKILKKAK